MGLSWSLSPRGRGGEQKDGTTAGGQLRCCDAHFWIGKRLPHPPFLSNGSPHPYTQPPFPFFAPADWSGDGLTETREEEEEEDRTNEVIRDRGRESTAADGVEKMKGNRIRNSPPLVFPSFSDFPPPFPDLFFPTPLRRSFRKPSLPSFPPLLPPPPLFNFLSGCCPSFGLLFDERRLFSFSPSSNRPPQ